MARARQHTEVLGAAAFTIASCKHYPIDGYGGAAAEVLEAAARSRSPARSCLDINPSITTGARPASGVAARAEVSSTLRASGPRADEPRVERIRPGIARSGPLSMKAYLKWTTSRGADFRLNRHDAPPERGAIKHVGAGEGFCRSIACWE